MGFDGSVRQRLKPPQNGGFTPRGQQLTAPGAIRPPIPPPILHPPPMSIPPIITEPPVNPEQIKEPIISDIIKMEMDEDRNEQEPTLSDKMLSLLRKGIGCDVEFIFSKLAEAKSLKAHKCVLASGSKVFEELFYSVHSNEPPMKKRRNENRQDVTIIEVDNLSFSAISAVIEYLYSDGKPSSIKIPDDCVLDTLRAAQKYGIAKLETACVKILGDIAPSLAPSLLEEALQCKSIELIERCNEIIDENTDEALSSRCIRNLKKETLKRIIERSELTPSEEAVIFRAANEWADAECSRHHLDSTPQNKRTILGDILYAIRFPIMSLEEFGEAANSGLLNDDEIGVLFRYLSSVVRPPLLLPFDATARRCFGGSKHIVKRFIALSSNHCRKQRSSV